LKRLSGVRDGTLGLALHWQMTLRDGEAKKLALEHLAEAAELACEACG
jgi:hypothetical protein